MTSVLLLLAALPHPLVGDQAVRHFGERGLDGFLVLHQRAVRARASASLTLDLKRPAVKMGCATCGAKFQALCGSAEQARQLRALSAQRIRSGSIAGKYCRPRDADLGVGGDQVLLRRPDVGTAFQQRRWQPGGNFGREFLLRETLSRAARCRDSRRATDDPIFGLFDLLLDRPEWFRPRCRPVVRPGADRAASPRRRVWRDLVSSSDSCACRRVRLRDLQRHNRARAASDTRWRHR